MTLVERVFSLLRGKRHTIVRDVVLPRPLDDVPGLVAAAGPRVLLDRATSASAYAERAYAVLDPRFRLVAFRASGMVPRAMPWDDATCPPRLVARARTVVSFGEEREEHDGCPFMLAEALLAAARGSSHPDAPPFACGLVGTIAYGAAAFLDTLPPETREGADGADIDLLFADSSVSTASPGALAARIHVVGRGATDDEARADAEARESRLFALLASPLEPDPPRVERAIARASYGERSYSDLVERAKAHLVAGDVFQLCLTHTVALEPAPAPHALFAELRRSNPAPFSAYFLTPDTHLVSSSPERFLRVHEGNVETRPIKGTRPRGHTPADDERLADDLARSEKDGAENDMIVDLLRNDLARVAEPGSVVVRERRIVERHPTVLQLVSTVVGTLRPGLGPIDVLRSAFPGGSMTGAPKARAVELLAELEPRPRGVYSGTLVYIDERGTMDASIVIRSVTFSGDRATFGVGGGIVLDSVPEDEWRETLAKARALVDAAGAALGAEMRWELDGS